MAHILERSVAGILPDSAWVLGSCGLDVLSGHHAGLCQAKHDVSVDEEQLEGGITNTGSVVRVGGQVLRPSTSSSESVQALLLMVRAAGFEGVPQPFGIDADGRERLGFVEGDVPLSPYPAWSQTDAALVSIAQLLRRFHDAARNFDAAGRVWNSALADPLGGDVVCHNDVELSNVVFRDGVAVALIDFEFAAPGRVVFDVAQFARLCVPIEHEVDQARMGWKPADRPARLRLIADSYGLDRDGRAELLDALEDALDRIESAARASAREHDGLGSASTLAATGGLEKYDRRKAWWQRHKAVFVEAMR